MYFKCTTTTLKVWSLTELKKNGGKLHCSCPVATYSKQGSLYVQFVKLMSAKQRKFIKID